MVLLNYPTNKMRNYLPLLFVLIQIKAGSQTNNFSFPKIAETGASIASFIPRGWHIRDSVSGDLNKDGLKDFVAVIESDIPHQVTDKLRDTFFPFYPKMLLVFFRQPKNSFILSATAVKLFQNCNWGVAGQDPFEKLFLRKGTFGISFYTGGFIRDHLSYIFRYQNSIWYLIGLDRYQFWIADESEGTTYACYNFATQLKENYFLTKAGKRTDFRRSRLPQKQLTQLVDLDEDWYYSLGDEGE